MLAHSVVLMRRLVRLRPKGNGGYRSDRAIGIADDGGLQEGICCVLGSLLVFAACWSTERYRHRAGGVFAPADRKNKPRVA